MDPIKPPKDMIEAILARTSGRTCDTARERVCDFVDGRLESVDAQLVQLHLEGCADCAELASAVARLTGELPALAELQLDDRFLGEVVARTSGRRRWAAQLAARIIDGVQIWAGRPRFALEASYVGTCALLLVFGIPSSPLAGVPGKAFDLMTRNHVQEVQVPLVDLGDTVFAGVQGAWGKTSDRVGTFWDRLASPQETDETKNQGESK